jgi:hypothetical protein
LVKVIPAVLCETDQHGHGYDLHLLPDSGAMHFDCLLARPEFGCDLLIPHTGDDRGKDLVFSRSQGIDGEVEVTPWVFFVRVWSAHRGSMPFHGRVGFQRFPSGTTKHKKTKTPCQKRDKTVRYIRRPQFPLWQMKCNQTVLATVSRRRSGRGEPD